MTHGDLGILQHVFALLMQLRIEQSDADRGRQRNFDFIEGDGRRQSAAHDIGERGDLVGIGFRRR